MGRRTLKSVLMDIWEAVKVTWQGLSYQVKEVVARMGRRKMPDDRRKNRYLEIRITESEMQDLDEIAEMYEMTKADVVRYSIDMLKRHIDFHSENPN